MLEEPLVDHPQSGGVPWKGQAARMEQQSLRLRAAEFVHTPKLQMPETFFQNLGHPSSTHQEGDLQQVDFRVIISLLPATKMQGPQIHHTKKNQGTAATEIPTPPDEEAQKLLAKTKIKLCGPWDLRTTSLQ